VDANIIVNAGANALFGISANGSGDVLLQTINSGTIVTNAEVRSGTGNITLNSRDPLTLVDRLRTSAPGTIYVTSAGDVTVNNLVTGNVNLVVTSGRDIVFDSSLALGTINAGTGRVYLDATRDIRDNNATNNVVNVTASALGMQAGGKIGDADLTAASVDTNRNAIGTSVDTLAARSATGIYVQEAINVTINTVTVAANQVNFNSTRTDRTRTLEDLTTTNNGPIKLQAVNGNIVVNPGTAGTLGISANGTGNILLQTVNSGSITINAGLNSERGAISLIARENITQSANGDIQITTGTGVQTNTIYAQAVTGSIQMNADASSTTKGGNIFYRAANNVTVGILNAGTGGIWVQAGGSILDAQEDTVAPGAAGFATATGVTRVVNIDARTTVLQAGGSIGVEGNPIDTNVDVIAGASKNGIFIRESNQLIVGQIASSNVQRVHFRSDTATVSGNAEFGLRATDGPIRVLTEQQNLFIDRTINASASANAATASEADDNSARKDVTLIALQGEIEQRAGTAFSLTSNAAIGATILNLADTSSFTVGMRIAIWDADSGRQDVDVIGVGAGTIQISSPLTRAITAATSQIIQHRSQVVGEELYLSAKNHAHLYDASVTKLFSKTETNRTLDAWEHVNINASQRGDDFLIDLETKIPGLTFTDAIKRQYRFAETYAASGYSLYIVNSRDVKVQDVTAGISNSPNIYIETLGESDITVEKPVETKSTNGTEGAIIVVAGDAFKITGTGVLQTYQNSQAVPDQIITRADAPPVPPDVTDVRARFFHFLPNTPAVLQAGNPGIPPTFFTTQTILTIDQIARVTETISSNLTDPKHVLMQVAIQFGSALEKGFESFIAYADKRYALGNVADGTFVGTVGLRSQINATVYPHTDILPAAVKDGLTTGLFVRLEPFDSDFIRNSPDNTFTNHAALRRANDFFIFEKAAGETGDIKDLTVQTDRIDVIRDSMGLANTAAPDPTSPVIRAVVTSIPQKFDEPIVRIDTTTIEFGKVVDRQAIFELYRVEFDDNNLDGQPDSSELPEQTMVLERIQGANQSEIISFPLDEEGKSTKPSAEVTQADINRIKEALKRDPQAQVGVYSIVRVNTNGVREVLEIFPVRDSEEPPSDENEKIDPPAVDPGQKAPGGTEDGAFYLPPQFQGMDDYDPNLQLPREDERVVSVNPTVSLAVMLGAISLRSSRRVEDPAVSVNAPEGEVQFARDARRKRRREAVLQAWSQARGREE
jgi:hypothetical protein